jgi:hypothetical protein
MKTIKMVGLVGWLLVAVVALSACSIHIDRNDDGSLRAETSMSAESIQKEIAFAIRDPKVKELTVDLKDGYMLVTGVKEMPVGDHTDELSFRMTLGVNDGHLTATISDAKFNQNPIDGERVAEWNERIAQNLEKRGQNHPNSTLESVRVTPDGVTMAWRIETKYSKGE